jgi:hypothetical protein
MYVEPSLIHLALVALALALAFVGGIAFEKAGVEKSEKKSRIPLVSPERRKTPAPTPPVFDQDAFESNAKLDSLRPVMEKVRLSLWAVQNPTWVDHLMDPNQLQLVIMLAQVEIPLNYQQMNRVERWMRQDEFGWAIRRLMEAQIVRQTTQGNTKLYELHERHALGLRDAVAGASISGVKS